MCGRLHTPVHNDAVAIHASPLNPVIAEVLSKIARGH